MNGAEMTTVTTMTILGIQIPIKIPRIAPKTIAPKIRTRIAGHIHKRIKPSSKLLPLSGTKRNWLKMSPTSPPLHIPATPPTTFKAVEGCLVAGVW